MDSPATPSSFPRFFDLPLELQVLILRSSCTIDLHEGSIIPSEMRQYYRERQAAYWHARHGLIDQGVGFSLNGKRDYMDWLRRQDFPEYWTDRLLDANCLLTLFNASTHSKKAMEYFIRPSDIILIDSRTTLHKLCGTPIGRSVRHKIREVIVDTCLWTKFERVHWRKLFPRLEKMHEWSERFCSQLYPSVFEWKITDLVQGKADRLITTRGCFWEIDLKLITNWDNMFGN